MIWSEYYSTPSGESGYVWQLIIHWSNEQMIVLDGTMVQIHLYIYDAIVWLSDDKTITNSRIAFAFSIQVKIRYIWIQFMLRLCTKKRKKNNKTIFRYSDILQFFHCLSRNRKFVVGIPFSSMEIYMYDILYAKVTIA